MGYSWYDGEKAKGLLLADEFVGVNTVKRLMCV